MIFFFKQKTAYELRISDWSSDVCSSDLITDERTGLVHDYTRKQGVEHSELMLPTDAPEWAADRERLWNAAELEETRKNATVAREYEIALPVELSAEERRELALGSAREISARPGVAESGRGAWRESSGKEV